MRPIQRSEILSIGDYEAVRPQFQARVTAARRGRKLWLGEHLSAVFEDRDWVILQIQEMLRSERITNERAILYEIATYKDLLPGMNQLSVRISIEVSDMELRERMLVDLAGLEESIWLDVDGERSPIVGPRRVWYIEGRTSNVHYLKVGLPPSAAGRIRERAAKVAIVVTHARYQARTELPPETLTAIAQDLAS